MNIKGQVFRACHLFPEQLYPEGGNISCTNQEWGRDMSNVTAEITPHGKCQEAKGKEGSFIWQPHSNFKCMWDMVCYKVKNYATVNGLKTTLKI